MRDVLAIDRPWTQPAPEASPEAQAAAWEAGCFRAAALWLSTQAQGFSDAGRSLIDECWAQYNRCAMEANRLDCIEPAKLTLELKR